MRVCLVLTDFEHPILERLQDFATANAKKHLIEIVDRVEMAQGGDSLFLISCHEIVPESVRRRFRRTLVIHASDLPQGRGWSPLVWSVLEGETRIVVSLLEAADRVDSGAICAKRSLQLNGYELYDEINRKLFETEIALIEFAIENFDNLEFVPQEETKASFRRRRTKEDSRIDPDASIRSQFNLLRVADPNRYPAFFEIDGFGYEISLKRR